MVLHSVHTTSSKGNTTEVRFTVTAAMMPSLRLLVLFPRVDGEIVGDLIEVPVTCELQHKVWYIEIYMWVT